MYCTLSPLSGARQCAAAGEETKNLNVHSHLCVERDSAAAGEETKNYEPVVVRHQPVQVSLPDGF